MQIQWYPGHMTKARRQMQEDMKLIDLCIELLDARVPLSSRNPDIDTLARGKYRMVILNKSDLASSDATKQWMLHANVVRDIRNLDCSDEFRLINFDESTYINAQGHKQPCFNMTRDGFVFLVMGYRGKKAASFKEAYIKRFNEMEEFIKYLLEARTEFPLLTDNIMLIHETPKPYHFSNEADLLNRIVLGKTAKQVREEYGLKAGTSIRPYLTTKQIEAIDLLQRVDIGLLVSTPDFQERKRYLEWYYMKKLQ